MIQKIPKDQLYTSDHGWLQSKFLFSFAEYYDPTNMEWGSLRVFNDDTIAPHSGFPMHSHSEMEIVTIMLKGSLTHKDSMGNTRTITKGYVQRMSAGTGVTHSEMNDGDEQVELFQLWFYPNVTRLTPSYEEKEFQHLRSNGLHTLTSAGGDNGSISFSSNAKVFYGNFKQGDSYALELEDNDYALLYVRKGNVSIGDITLSESDQLRAHHETELTLAFNSDSEFIVIASH